MKTETIPTYQEFMNPLLQVCFDGAAHSVNDLEAATSKLLSLTNEQREILLPSGNKAVVRDRAHWAAYYLKRAGLLKTIKRGVYQITELGKTIYQSGDKVDSKYLEKFDSFLEFKYPDKTEIDLPSSKTAEEKTPEEVIDSAYKELKNALAEELLERILSSVSPKQFEYLVVDVLAAMGYGGGKRRSKDFIQVTSYSNDGGIDGIIKEDALGLDRVCVQAKRYANGSIGRPDIQSFAGSLDGQGAKKGVFITTSTFTKDAIEFALSLREKRIILINGQELAMYMIDNGVGVSEVDRIILHRIDSDYFDRFEQI